MDAFKNWSNSFNSSIHYNNTASDNLNLILEDNEKSYKSNKYLQSIFEEKDMLKKQSTWIVGGDGWAYDIGIHIIICLYLFEFCFLF